MRDSSILSFLKETNEINKIRKEHVSNKRLIMHIMQYIVYKHSVMIHDLTKLRGKIIRLIYLSLISYSCEYIVYTHTLHIGKELYTIDYCTY